SAVNALRKRHWILRSKIVVVDGEPEQEVMPFVPIELECSVVDEISRHKVQLMARDLASEPAELSDGSSFGSKLVTDLHAEHALLLKGHHMFCDGESLNILIAELEQLCLHIQYPSSFSPPPRPGQFVDYVYWER